MQNFVRIFPVKISMIIVVCSLFIIHNGFTQTDRVDELKNVIPPSPEAASLGKYAEWPVNLYTGVPNIDIPLYTVKGRTIAVPISISYHASGIRVSEVASSIGLGWALNAGGIISRSVRGVPDDQTNGYFNFRNRYTNPNDLSSPVNAGEIGNQNQAWVADGDQDSEQDMYSISALGKSYKLLFMSDGSIVTNPVSQVKITVNFPANIWTVVLEDGTVLNFGGADGYLERTDNPRADIPLYTSSWLLRSVISSLGETVDFSYQLAAGVGQPASLSKKDKIGNNLNLDQSGNLDVNTQGIAGCACGDDLGGEHVGHGGMVEQTVGIQMLASIETNIEKVEFVLGPTRQDLQGGYPYSGLKVFSKIKGVYVEEYAFISNYSSAIPGTTFSTSNSYKEKRLRLVSLEKRVPNTTMATAKWEFMYNPQNLPSRVSSAQDHWGFFNGSTQNESFLPYLPPVGYYNGFTPNVYKFGNREPNAALMQAEMLSKIVYPTGGWSAFEYEPNSYFKTEEQFKDSTLELSISSSSSPFVNTKSLTFNVTKEQYLLIEFDAQFSASYLNDHSARNTLAYVKVTGPNGEIVATIGVKNSGVQRKYFTLNKHYSQSAFPTGTYTFLVYSKGDFANADDINISAKLKYSKSQGSKSGNKIAGGLRIKKISDYDNTGASPIIRTFQYNDPLVLREFNAYDEYVTSLKEQKKAAKIVYEGGIPYQGCEYESDFSEPTCFQDYLIRNAYAKTSVASYPIGYGKVTTRLGEFGQNGQSVSIFSNVPDAEIDRATKFPFPPAVSNQWQRGALLRQIDLNASLDTLKEVTNQYVLELSNHELNFFKTGREKIYRTFNNDPYKFKGTKTVYYKEITGRQKLISTTQIDHNGSDKLSTVTNYFYDNPANLTATRTETTNSKGEIIKKINRTPLEKDEIISSAGPLTSGAIAAIDLMKTKNMVSTVMESEEFLNNLLVKRILINDSIWNNMPLPKSVKVQNGTGPFETRIQFTAYDQQGNLLEQNKVSDVKHTYLWGYGNHFVMADVISASNADIAYTSFETNEAGNWNVPAQRNTGSITGSQSYSLSNGNITRTGLTSSRKYIVSFWSTGSSIQVNGANLTSGQTRNGWTYYESTLSNVSAITISGSSVIDELRLYPVGSQMTTYTYEPLLGVTSKTDANNQIVFFEYDSIGRLSIIRDDNLNIVKHYEYNYQTR